MSAFVPAVKEQILPHGSLALDQVRSAMLRHGVTRLLAKPLSPNDNSKNQIYLGGDLSVINTVPAGDPVASTSGKQNEPIFKAPLDFLWLDDSGEVSRAPNAQLILYPQYPEVRMSGFLLGARNAPSGLLASRAAGRVLLLGIRQDRQVIGYAAHADSPIARELAANEYAERTGVLFHVPIAVGTQTDSRTRLLAELCRISRKEWISGWRLLAGGERTPCAAPNCVGVTLESELNITANGRSDPDFEGWEVKGHTVTNLTRHEVGTVTLMTPEPNGGVYADDGAIAFVRRFGYGDMRGRADRMNFGGVHRVGTECELTGLTLVMDGYDAAAGKIVRSDGALRLIDVHGTVAASWNFAGLLAHWNRKHAKAAYVPALKRLEPQIGYRYGNEVLLAEGTDYRCLFDALTAGVVYYDPGIKVESVSGRPVAKKRSQFRVRRSQLRALYHRCSVESVCR